MTHLIVLAAALSIAAPATTGSKPPVLMKAEQCLRDNVARVVAVEPSLQSAADFLVNYACSVEVTAVERYRKNLNLAATETGMLMSMLMLSKGNAGQASPPLVATDYTITVDPETGDFVIPAGAVHSPFTGTLPQMGLISDATMIGPPPADLRKLAGELVLSERERQLRRH